MKSLLIPASLLAAASLLILSAISTRLFLLQALWILLGLCIVVAFFRLDWKTFLRSPWFVWGFYFAVLGLLFLADIAAPLIRNKRSWLAIGPFTIQPVEFAKIALILVYALYFSRRHMSIARWNIIIASFVFFLIPAGLVMLQPDLGSTVILFGVWFGFLLSSGLPKKRLLFFAGIFAVVAIFGWSFGLKDYQRARIVGMFHPNEDVLGINYSVAQSKIAIGSGGWWGKGYGQGSQTQLHFLTEPEGDFVFASFLEEWGIAGALVVIGAFLWLMFSILRVGASADTNFERFLCLGTVMVFGIQFLFNTGSALGIFPVIGVTFPFLSYGGSSLLTSAALLAIINTIARTT